MRHFMRTRIEYQGLNVKQRTVLPTKPREQLVTRNPHHRHVCRM